MYKELFLPTQKTHIFPTFYVDLFYFNFTKQKKSFTQILLGKLFGILSKFEIKKLCF